MANFNFKGPPVGGGDISAECQGQLLPFVRDIVQSAVAAGWNQDDVLLAFVELTWDLYEKRRGDV